MIININEDFYKRLGLWLYAWQTEQNILQILELIKEKWLRQCSRCGEIKELNGTYFYIGKNRSTDTKIYFYMQCRCCHDNINKRWHKSLINKGKNNIAAKKWRLTHSEQRKQIDKNYGQKPETKKKISERNKQPQNKEKRNEREKKRLQNEPTYKLRKSVSRDINAMLKSMGATKQGQSILNKLNYTFETLVSHLESLFPFYQGNKKFTWKNHGKLWHIDHIIPQTHLLYDSMDHPNFPKSWALDNLRPLNAIINRQDGDRRTSQQIAAIKSEIAAYLAKKNKL